MYIKKIIRLIDNYAIARWQNRPSTASFWYLPDPPILTSVDDFVRYKECAETAPPYFMNYAKKLSYSLENETGIIVLPYDEPIGQQINPEAAFQYALGLHDSFNMTKDPTYLEKFLHYANFFVKAQSAEGFWAYNFDWFASKAPWYSALAQARGASVMFRAWLHSADMLYLKATEKALSKFNIPIDQGGFLHVFGPTNTPYFEEYPKNPTGVINGFMATLLSIWELKHWLKQAWLEGLWSLGLTSLEAMLPYYSNSWWSLYDLDDKSPLKNINSPRYHLLEMHYLQVLSIISESTILRLAYVKREKQYNRFLLRQCALGQKFLRKVIYK